MAGTESENNEEVKDYAISIRSDAEADITDAYQYYEDKAEGLGLEFLRAVEACLASIQRYPAMNAIIHKDIRRAILRRFPYGVFYRIEDRQITVVACFHASRDPRNWQRRS